MEQKYLKKLLVFEINAFESGTRNSHNPEQDICNWHPMCYRTPLGFNISLREIFSESEYPRVMVKDDEIFVMEISQEFGTL